MDPSKDKTPPSSWMAVSNLKFLQVGAAVGCVTVLIVLLFVFGGLWLDNLLGTKPLLTILLVLASAPISLILTFWLAKRAVSEIRPSQPVNASEVPQANEGDDA